MCDLSKGTHPSQTVPHTESVLANISSLHKLKKYAMFQQDCRVSTTKRVTSLLEFLFPLSSFLFPLSVLDIHIHMSDYIAKTNWHVRLPWLCAFTKTLSVNFHTDPVPVGFVINSRVLCDFVTTVMLTSPINHMTHEAV